MRQVWSAQEFDDALAAAKREAMSSFNDDKMLVEKYLTEPRHVEIQVFCDNHKNGVYLFERDCSIQRRHQKVIEEAPAPNMPESLRKSMGEAALKAAFAINYAGAGTVEFLLDTDGSFYFMEMNTRLQVEHPVTEMITGEDLVEWQIRVANNEVLPKTQEQLTMRGHSFEARVYAEDPNNDFLPATGTLSLLKAPQENGFVRVDTGVEQGDEVSIYYDPMIAKLIVWDEDREKALARLAACLGNYAIGGVITNIDYLKRIASSEPFQAAHLSTDFIERHQESISTETQIDEVPFLPELALLALLNQQGSSTCSSKHLNDPWSRTDNYRSNHQYQDTLVLTCSDKAYAIGVTQLADNRWLLEFETDLSLDAIEVSGDLTEQRLRANKNGLMQNYHCMQIGTQLSLFTPMGIVSAEVAQTDLGEQSDDDGANAVVAPMNGTVVDLLVGQGDVVEKGQVLIIVEAMKMEHAIKAPFAGTVKECFFHTGDLVSGGIALIDIEASDGDA